MSAASPTSPATAPPGSARERFLLGVRDGIPPAFGCIPWGMAFGLLIVQFGLPPLQTLGQTAAMSAWWYSGTAQFVALELWKLPLDTATFGAIILAVFGINSRYLLQGAALSPWLTGIPAWRLVPTLFFMVDITWALAMKRFARYGRDIAYFLGSSTISWVVWVASSVGGALLPTGALNAKAWGLDFAMAAVLVAFAGGRLGEMDFRQGTWRAKTVLRMAAPWLVAGASAWLTHRWLGGNAHILVGAVTGATCAALLLPSTNPAAGAKA